MRCREIRTWAGGRGGRSLLADLVDFFFNCELVEGLQGQVEKQADSAVEHEECVAECFFNLLKSACNSGRVGNAPMRRHRLAGPDRAYFLRGVIADREDEIELRR